MSEAQYYDPRQLIEDVVSLLADRGVTPDREAGTPMERNIAASQLLRHLGITPAVRPENWLDLDGHLGYNRRVHGN